MKLSLFENPLFITLYMNGLGELHHGRGKVDSYELIVPPQTVKTHGHVPTKGQIIAQYVEKLKKEDIEKVNSFLVGEPIEDNGNRYYPVTLFKIPIKE